MARRKKHPKLPNGFGSIRYLGSGRRNPYAVHPPAQENDETGKFPLPPALCYVSDWYVGFAVLTALKAGTYEPGLENVITVSDSVDSTSSEELTRRLLGDFNRIKRIEDKANQKTFSEVFNAFMHYKFDRDGAKKLSLKTREALNTGYRHCSDLYKRNISDIKHTELQALIDKCPRKNATKEQIKNLLTQMFAFAEAERLIEVNPARKLSINSPYDGEKGEPFTDDELKVLWKHEADQTVEFLLIMCYSGFRISAYSSIEVNLEEMYFKGGIKTESSIDRIVPIHSAILPLVRRRMKRDGGVLTVGTDTFRTDMYETLNNLNIPKRTPHDCRHTFSKLCEDYEVKENDRKRMLGHSFGADITNRVYGHRELDKLRTEIEKIKKPIL